MAAFAIASGSAAAGLFLPQQSGRSGGAQEADATPDKGIDPHAFGMHLVGVTGWDQDGTTPLNTPRHTFGCRSLRIWDCGVPWWRIESSRGRYDWSRLNAEMRIWTVGYDDIIYCLGQTPNWASGEMETSGWTRPAPPRIIADAANFVTALLERYPQITAVECWNEPENRHFYTGSIQDLVDLTLAQSAAARSVRPGVKVLSACPQSFGDRGSYLRAYLRVLFKANPRSIDVVSVHTYVMPRQPEAIYELVRGLREIIVAEGFGHLPMWSTEFGWGGVPGAPRAGGFVDWRSGSNVFEPFRVMDQCQAQALQRQYFYAADKKFSAIRLLDFNSNNKVLPPGAALTYLSGLLAGGAIGALDRAGPVFRVPIRTAQGREGQALWCADGNSSRVELGWASEIRSVTGFDAGAARPHGRSRTRRLSRWRGQFPIRSRLIMRTRAWSRDRCG
ncbi:hypothetical protein [Caulobacter sp. DWR2-3-1b2]|uniref:hypothetical protein n=1 Tax=unclassified Caulobacter TaxID=2648921 RepID=UPI003CEAB4C4